MENLNVCLINDSFPPVIDGVANAVVNYATVISRSLGRATVATPYYPDADDSKYSFPVVRYPSLDTSKLVGYRAGMPVSVPVLNELSSARFDIIHTHCPVTSTVLARSLRGIINAPVVFTYHTKFDIDIANAVSSQLLQEEAASILVQNISACDEVWAVSDGAGKNLQKLGYQGDYIVMPNGVDLPRGRVSDEEIASACSGYDLPADVPVFLFVGRMMWYKGARITLDALKLLKDSGADFRMVFIGGGADKEEIKAYSTSLALDDKVIFVDPIYDRNIIRAWYCRADLFIFPSTFDTNGLVVREAAACSLASVLVRGSCAAEDVTEDINAFLIDEDAQSLYEKLASLFPRRDTMRAIGEKALDELYMSWDESVSRAYERYGVVIENYKAGKYPEHNTFADGVYRGAAKSLETIFETRDILAEAGSAIALGAAGTVSDAKSLISDMGDSFRQGRDKLNGFFNDFYREYK